MKTVLASWWNREAGGREILALAIPLCISTSSWTIMQFIDRLFLYWYTPVALAAALPSALVSFLSCCVFFGVASYVNTFVSQYYGAGRSERIGLAVWQGVWIALFITPPLFATIPMATWLFSLSGHDAAVQHQEVVYYQICTLGAPAVVIGTALSAFFTGRGDVRTIMVVDLLAAAVNIFFDYLWIFGRGGFPELGIAGAAWATILAQWLKAVICLWLFLQPQFRAAFGTWSGCRFDGELLSRLLRFGTPSGMQWLLEAGGFTGLVMLVGRLGQHELTVTNLVFNVGNIGFLPLYGFSVAATTYVGQKLGENRPDLAARGAWTAFHVATVYIAVVSTVFTVFPDVILSLHAGEDAAQFAATRDLAVVLLRFVALYCLFDAMNLIFIGALKGAGDTRFIMINSAIMSTIPCTIAWVGIEHFGFGLMATWVIITVWVILLGLIYLARFLQGRWKSMRVIEAQMIDEPDAELVLEGAGIE
ncbi:MAG: MATE family efflux transporter [Pirellulales bacterium]|nr:MATE family efflux transporter [Pirellulales bacterium]